MIFKKTVILGAICLGSITLMAPSALAVTSVGDSKATIKFIAGTGVVDPVDPTDPGTGNTGALTLDYVSSVAFGEQEISSNEATYSATSRKPFIQVSDRRGTGKGWYVTATASAFQDEYGTNSLAGATLSFQNGEAVSASTTTTSPTASQKVDIPTDGTSIVDVISAEETEGMGTWINRWLGATPDDVDSLNDNVKLVIPAGSATLGDHEATITWTLSDAPGA
ncbi:WxL domain-containing protein [Listeria ivanovii]|uniref:Putative secreted protein n=1 Tax=Listeria ivanovii (strain ATCC BAA-678 / PAM 55) TaxID=881621 RepID=G2ZBX4_LISIP|nr:WxL domain-containing protein [Listeria ivanovii]AHI55100.1 hypothetical protein AX25_02915 [Listeria ivanovii WSLC3009]AIS64559.1 Sporozoite surface protein 2 [Listeria ivanovii subsp. ivanovii]MBC1758770.1 WxL domain-containing protein [Listeria ivanovii]MCJ1716679.1 WxL domain-containing protein [Listeria ivanovii]MCJ1721413.1 WxL domain-containing protein [Listeria ivanovii]